MGSGSVKLVENKTRKSVIVSKWETGLNVEDEGKIPFLIFQIQI